MRCQRCQGYMVVELIEPTVEETAKGTNGWRCVMCGDIVDSVIAAHRDPKAPLSFAREARRRGLT